MSKQNTSRTNFQRMKLESATENPKPETQTLDPYMTAAFSERTWPGIASASRMCPLPCIGVEDAKGRLP